MNTSAGLGPKLNGMDIAPWGKNCTEITSGDMVGVAGTRQSDGSVLATTVSANK